MPALPGTGTRKESLCSAAAHGERDPGQQNRSEPSADLLRLREAAIRNERLSLLGFCPPSGREKFNRLSS
eukprot:scaffold1247_cov251-Pinguiococcus_pyrenoidosus.AAC.19